jgi:hypothetical protein
MKGVPLLSITDICYTPLGVRVKAVQDQLHHKAARMTLRYLKILSVQESLKIEQKVDFGW